MAKKIHFSEVSRVKEYGILSFCWSRKLLGENMKSTDGKSVEVIDAGLYNRNYGPDFFNAKIRINNTLFVGNVMVLWNTNEWYSRKLNEDHRYDNVILVVSLRNEMAIVNSRGEQISLIVKDVPEYIRKNYQTLLSDKGHTLCREHVGENLPALTKHAWLAAVETEWMEKASEQMRKEAESSSWETALVSGISNNTDKTLSRKFMNEITKAESATKAREIIKNFLSSTGQSTNRTKVENILLGNIIPWLFAYGRHTCKEKFCDMAFDMTEETKAVHTRNIKAWEPAGLNIKTGTDCKAVQYLCEEYCSKRRCLQCRFGMEYLKHKSPACDDIISRNSPINLAFCFC